LGKRPWLTVAVPAAARVLSSPKVKICDVPIGAKAYVCVVVPLPAT
jgi:hypothetical protein